MVIELERIGPFFTYKRSGNIYLEKDKGESSVGVAVCRADYEKTHGNIERWLSKIYSRCEKNISSCEYQINGLQSTIDSEKSLKQEIKEVLNAME